MLNNFLTIPTINLPSSRFLSFPTPWFNLSKHHQTMSKSIYLAFDLFENHVMLVYIWCRWHVMLHSNVPHTHLTLPLNVIDPLYAKTLPHRSLDVPRHEGMQRVVGWTILGRHIVESHPYLHVTWHSSMPCRLFDVRKRASSCREHYWASLGQWHQVCKVPLACGEPSSSMTRGDHNVENPMVRIAPSQGFVNECNALWVCGITCVCVCCFGWDYFSKWRTTGALMFKATWCSHWFV